MAGFPFSGKSYVLEAILSKIAKEVLVICPKDYRDDNLKLKKEDQCKMDIAAWDVSLEALWEHMQRVDDTELIFFDTACASLAYMRYYFEGAKRFGHNVGYIYVQANLAECKKRANDKWLPQDVLKRYKKKFIESIEPLIKLSDWHFIIKNNLYDHVPDVSKIVTLLS